jgi:glycine dehydrogenase subunit 1
MPFIPHTETDVTAMLAAIGAPSIDALFDEIPVELTCGGLPAVPEALSEMALLRLAGERAQADGAWLNFIGAGAYEHHIPAAVWPIVTRGEFYTAYTPYQAEASQGTLQLLYEYQTMMCRLTGLEVSNASLYDGASALAEAILMAVRAHKGNARRVLVPATVHPRYRAVAAELVRAQGIELVSLPYCTECGHTLVEGLAAYAEQPAAALVIPQPNFFGVLEPVDALTDWAHAHNMLAIALVNPTAMALLKPPGAWGTKGADICVGDGQPLGIPLASGGPYLGFMTAKQALVRQMPGRIIGRTVDLDGKEGFTLTLQAREQHIRRAKATSNICSNQGLMVVAATIYMSLMGPGLARVASASIANTRALVERLIALPGVTTVFTGAAAYETVVRLPDNAAEVLRALRARGLLGGYALGDDYPELADCIVVCATETKTAADLDLYAEQLERILSRRDVPVPDQTEVEY